MRYVLLGEGELNARCLAWLTARGQPPLAHLRQPLGDQDRQMLRDLQPSFGLSLGYRHILTASDLTLFGQGVLNCHWGYLPWGRGADPQVWALLDGDPAGTTLHWMDAGLDTGPIVTQQRVAVTFGDTAATLYQRLQEASFWMVRAAWQDAERDGWSAGYFQPPGGSMHRRRDLHALDAQPLDRRTLDLLRARTFAPHPGMRYVVDGQTYDLTLTLREVSDDPTGA